MTDQDLNRIRAMTIGEWIDSLDPPAGEDTAEAWDQIEKVLTVILDGAIDFYDTVDDHVGRFALAVAVNIVYANGLDRSTTEAMLENMATCAYFMLEAEGFDEWGADLRPRLEAIKATGSRFDEPPTEYENLVAACWRRIH